jgi:adenosylcobyric acid synthase
MLVNEKYVHGGGKMGDDCTDMSVNINPLGTPEPVIRAIRESALEVCRYPDAYCTELTRGIGEMYGLPSEYVICGNGADELIYNFASLFESGSKAVIYAPAFAEYERALRAQNISVEYRTNINNIDLCGVNAVFLCNPSNPVGQLVDRNVLEQLIEKCSETNAKCFLDICFYELTQQFDAHYIGLLVEKFPNLCVLSAFTKTYAIPGVRLGYLMCSDTELISKISARQQCWNVSLVAQRAGVECLKCGDYVERSRRFIAKEREFLTENLKKYVQKIYHSDTNYILFYAPNLTADKLKEQGVIVRDCSDYVGLGKGYFRTCVGTHADNERLIEAVSKFPKKARPIMIQSTMSNAGKSLICTALCRIFAQDGYRVAPFKSQNMALNSYITEDGMEMGRAQAVQAEAAGVKPNADMNPILLKPTTDVGSQVIVGGKSVGNMKATDYFNYKKKLIPDIMEAYDRLAAENDIIVIEGAGSPAEINLKENDIVNMGLAELVDAPVLLVGDIDRGGVFAQLYGTVQLLEEHEASRIKGYIINKFRGDVSLLQSGLDEISGLTGKKCFGVVPYAYVDIDDEDSQSERLENNEQSVNVIDIAVIKLPRMSNYTDFTSLARFNGVNVRYVKNDSAIGNPDVVIIPGTKSTISDMRWMRESGMECAVKKLADKGTPIIGICGGLQILGRSITDESGAESMGSIRGMELLDIDTVFSAEKTQHQTDITVGGLDGIYSGLNGAHVHGYEIHMGNSGAQTSFIQNGNVLATYIHGCFDNGLDDRLIELLSESKGVDRKHLKPLSYNEYRQQQYDKLADIVRDSLDMDAIYDELLMIKR